jgi:heterodisulfide reductase subunit C
VTIPIVVDLEFAGDIAESDQFDAWECMNCGVCSVACPLEIDLLPRTLFRYAVLGLREELLAQTHVIFQCLLCKACEESCTAGVHITQNVRFLRGYITREVFGL